MKHHLVELEARAGALKNAGRNAEAAELFSSIVKEQPDWEHGTAYHLLAQCYEDSGQFELAEESYRIALKYEPANDIFLGGLASFLYIHGKPEEAFNAYLEVLKADKSDGNTGILRESSPARLRWNPWERELDGPEPLSSRG
jgi:Tfp pilus assembly protein PilF